MSEPDPDLINAIYRDRIRAARRMTPAEKLALGGDLFDEVCERMRAGIRHQFPDADGADVERILRERLAIVERLETTA
jgi:hypothetical protein